jgi:enamine deaminase RidA (YjgF/YER057c/UK114 family)
VITRNNPDVGYMDESTFAKRFGAAPPSSTWVGVTELAHPDQLVEITATAADLTEGGAK